MDKVIVLGGGLSGLAVGINALLKGFKCTILEKNNDVGGCLGAYTRKGFLIDHCIHWLIGSNKDNALFDEWRKLHAFKEDTKFTHLEYLVSIEYDGKMYRLSRDYKKSWDELLSLAPEDAALINEFFKRVEGALQVYYKIDFVTAIKNFIHIPGIIKTSNIDRIDFAQKFNNEGLRRLFMNAQNGYCNMMFFYFEYAHFILDNANIPYGGSLEMKKNIKEYFLELGGEIVTNCEVTNIETKKKMVSKIITSKGDFIGDYYVCTFSPYYAFNQLLNGIKCDNSLKRIVDKVGDTAPSVTQVSFVVADDISNWPTPYGIECNIKVGNKEYNTMMLRSYAYDPDLYIKEGKTVVNLLFDQNKEDYFYWKSLSKEQYIKEKERIVKEVFSTIEARFTNLKGKLELLDIITPLSLEKWTNGLYGAYQSFSTCKKSKLYFHSPKVKGLKNFFIVGIWTFSPGGLPVAGQAGDFVMPYLKKK